MRPRLAEIVAYRIDRSFRPDALIASTGCARVVHGAG
jgi:hypothetical protein